MNSLLQSGHYGQDYDYLEGSPHLRHRHLYDALTDRITQAITAAPASGSTQRVLEVGAGDGSITERLLSTGFKVTATELSQDSVATMETRFGRNDRFEVFRDDGDLESVGDSKFDAILFASVLHHIPDYLSTLNHALAKHLSPGGSLVSIQDPLRYDRLPGKAHRISNAAYLSWRITRGEISRGIKTRVRRRLSGVSEDEPSDSVEYHVTRNGVDELAIVNALDDHFDSVDLLSYWSTQGKLQQKLGERTGIVNTFAVFASGYTESDAISKRVES